MLGASSHRLIFGCIELPENNSVSLGDSRTDTQAVAVAGPKNHSDNKKAVHQAIIADVRDRDGPVRSRHLMTLCRYIELR